MENLTVNRTNCNTFVLTYIDTVFDLTVDIYKIVNISSWDGNFSNLPIYGSLLVPHVVLPNTNPIVTTLTLPSDAIYVLKYSKENVIKNPFHLCSRDEIQDMRNLITLDENFAINYKLSATDSYWLTNEVPNEEDPNSQAFTYIIGSNHIFITNKNTLQKLIGIREFVSTINYSLTDEDEYGGKVYKKTTIGNHSWRYRSVKVFTGESIWSNINNASVGTYQTTNGYDASIMIIGQLGHTTSAAQTILQQQSVIQSEYSLYTIFCDLIACKYKIIQRVLGELNNCKEQCVCYCCCFTTNPCIKK